MKLDRSIWIFGFLAFFLALAPFYPEPHLFGKIQWLIGGAVGMKPVDWYDLAIHGLPISIFLLLIGFNLGRQLKTGNR